MALIELDNGTLVDAPVLNHNFEYLDDKITTDITAITGGSTKNIAEIDSQIATISSSIGSGGIVPSGTIIMWGGHDTTPTGYLFCNGASYSKNDYPSLFVAIGYTYGGSGDSFNVPKLDDDRFVYGQAVSGGAYEAAGYNGNSQTSTGTTSWYGDHTHSYAFGAYGQTATGAAGGHNHTVSVTSYYHDTTHPRRMGIRFCIKY